MSAPEAKSERIEPWLEVQLVYALDPRGRMTGCELRDGKGNYLASLHLDLERRTGSFSKEGSYAAESYQGGASTEAVIGYEVDTVRQAFDHWVESCMERIRDAGIAASTDTCLLSLAQTSDWPRMLDRASAVWKARHQRADDHPDAAVLHAIAWGMAEHASEAVALLEALDLQLRNAPAGETPAGKQRRGWLRRLCKRWIPRIQSQVPET